MFHARVAIATCTIRRRTQLAAAVADRYVQVFVFPEDKSARIVITVWRRHVVDQYGLIGNGRTDKRKSRHAIDRRICAVVDARAIFVVCIEEIDVTVGGKVWVNRYAQQSALEIGADLALNVEN